MKKINIILVLALCFNFSLESVGQCVPCDVNTTTYTINFAANPDTSYTLSSSRNGHCCGATGNLKCIKFEITLNPLSNEFGFNVTNPAPIGAAFYQVNCGPQISLDSTLCVNGLTTFCVSFCKPGGDSPNYTLSASRNFGVSPDVTIHSNCATDLFVNGLTEPTIVWNSIFPGPIGTYNSYLSCTAACDTTTLTPQIGYPPFIDFEVSGTTTGCSTSLSKDTVRVYITPGVIATITPNPAFICWGLGTTTLTANPTGGAPPYSYNWSNGDTTQSTVVSSAGTYWVAITDTSAGCPAVYDTVVVTTSLGPITANAGPDQTICSSSPNVTLAGLVTQATGGIWTTSGTGTFAPSNTALNATYTPSAADITAGTVTLTLTTTGNGGCPAISDQMIITIQTAPVVNAGLDQTICAGDFVTLAGTVIGGSGSGIWTTSGNGTFTPSNTTLNATYTPSAADITAGTVTLTLTVTGSCVNPSDAMIITISPLIVVNANVDQIICVGDNVPLNGSVTGGSTTGIWTTTGTGTFAPSNTTLNATYTPSAADITAGTVTLILTSTNNGGCGAIIDSMVVTITQIPVVAAGPDQLICAGDNVLLSGSVTIGSTTGIWTTSGSGTFSPSNTALNATYTPSAADIIAGTVTLTLTSTLGCQNIVDQLVITISPAPIVNAGLDQSVCANNPVVTLAGSVTIGGSQGIWTTSGTGTFAPSNINLGATYTPSAGDITAGTVIIVLTSTDGCTAISDTMIITITPVPLVNAGPDITMCANNVVPLSGTVSGATTTGIWTTSGTGTFTPSTTTLNATYNPSTADTTAGTVTLTLTSTNNGGCLAVTDQLIITFTPAPTVTAGPDITVCANNSVITLAGSVTGGSSTGIWTTSGTGTFAPSNTILNATYTPSAADITAGTVTLSLISTNNGTCLPSSDQMIITITPAPIVNAGPDVTVCQNSPNVILTGTVTGGTTTGIWSTSGTGTFNPSNTTLNGTYIPSAGDITAGTVTLVLTSTNNGNCLIVTDTMVVTITNSPVVNAGPDVTMCANNVILLAGSVTGFTSTGIWSTSGTGTFSPNNTTLNATYIPSSADTTAGSVTLTLTSTNNSNCLAVTDQMTITFTPGPGVNAGPDIVVCANNLVANLIGTVGGGSTTGIWSTSGTGAFAPSNTNLNATYTLSAGDTAAGGVTIVLTSTNNGTCLPATDTMQITIIAAPITNAGPDQFICIGDSAILAGTVVNGGTTGQWSTLGTGSFIPSNTNLNATYVPSAGDYTAGSVIIVLTSTNNGNCLTTTDTMLITFTNPPTVNAGSDITICDNGVAQLAGIVSGTSTTGIWITSGTGTFSPSNTTLNATYTPSAADITAGTVTLTLQSTFSCLAIDQLTITITPGPQANAGPDQILCITTNQVSLTGIIGGNTTTGVWSTTGTGNFTPSNTTLNATYNISALDSIAGTFMLILTSTNNGACAAISDTMVVTLTTIPTVNAGADTTFCANNFANLNGIVTGGASTGIWSTSGTGIFNPSNITLNALYIPSAGDITAGTVTLTLSSTGACVTITDNIVITITPAPVVFAGNDTTICDSTVLQLNGVITGGSSTGIWTSSGDGVFAPTSSILNPTYTPGTNDINNGTFDLYLSSTNNGDCIAVDDTLTVLLLSAPTANAGGNQTICGGSNVTLSGSISSGPGFWTTTGTGTFSPNNTTLNGTYIPSSADTAAGSVQLILGSSSLNICGQDFDTITITFVSSPVVNAGPDFTICANNDTIQLAGITTNGLGYWTTTGTGTFIPNDSLLNSMYLPSGLDITNGQVTFVLYPLNVQNCPAVTDTVTVTISPAPLVNAGPDISICLTSLMVTLNGSVTGGSTTGFWTTNGTGTFIPDSLSLTTTYQPSNADTTAGTIWFILTSSNNGLCNPESDTLIVTFDAAPLVNAGLDVTACQLDTTMLLATINGGGTTVWTTNGGGTFTPDSLANPVGYLPIPGDTAGPIQIIVTYTNGCGSIDDTLMMTVLPEPGLSMSYVVDCETFEVQFGALTSGGSIQSVNWDFGDGGTDTIISPLHTYATTGTYTVTLVVVTTDGCTDSISQNIVIEPLPIADFTVSDSIITIGTTIFFNDTSTNASSWMWDFGDGLGPFFVEDTNYTYSDTGTYIVTLVVFNNSGCSDTARITIIVLSDDDVVNPPVLPGAFTPNGDLFNDVLFVRGGPFKEFDLRVYNEWGNEIFRADNQDNGWDGTYKGKSQPVGVYIYLFKGITIDGVEYDISGDFSLIK